MERPSFYWNRALSTGSHYYRHTKHRGQMFYSTFCVWNSFMMMLSNGTIFHVTGPLWGESTGQRWIPLTKASDAELWFFFDLRLNKQLSKQWRCQWFEMPSRSLWHHIMIITEQNWHIYILFSDRIICSSYKQMFDISWKMILGSWQI